MANSFYTNSYAGVDGRKDKAADTNAQFDLIEAGFDAVNAVGVLRAPAAVSNDLPLAANRFNKVLMFDSSGEPTVQSQSALDNHTHSNLLLLSRLAGVTYTTGSTNLITYDSQVFVEGGAYAFDGTDEVTLIPGQWFFWLWANLLNVNGTNIDVDLEIQIDGSSIESQRVEGSATAAVNWGRRSVFVSSYHQAVGSAEVLRANLKYVTGADSVTVDNTTLMAMRIAD